MAEQNRRKCRDRRAASERRQHNLSIIDNYLEYSGPERRSGVERRTLLDRRK